MLTQNDYDDLMSVSELPGGYYLENRRPDFMSGPHERYLLEMKYLERAALVPEGKEPEHPRGLSMIHVGIFGYHEMAVFEKDLADQKRQLWQYRITIALAILALPGALDGVVRLIQMFLLR